MCIMLYLCRMKLTIKKGFRMFEKLMKPKKKTKSVKKIKPVKKNTWKRKLRAWDLRIDRRQQQRTNVAVQADATERTCTNCGERYTGRMCPQCGQPGSWTRFTWKQAMLNLLDIWGLGNRPMFRTLKELLWRPGYMVRDYLKGHRQFYFPPFKLLAVSIVVLMFVSYLVISILRAVYGDTIDLTDLTTTSYSAELVNLLEGKQIEGTLQIIVNASLWLLKLLSKNYLYEWLFLAVLLAPCLWIGFRRVARYNFVETYVFIIYFMCLHTLLTIVSRLGAGFCLLIEPPIESLATAHGGVQQTAFFSILAIILQYVIWLVSSAFFILKCYLYALSVKQFYGLGWKSAIRRVFLSFLFGGWIIVMVVLTAILFLDFPVDKWMIAIVIFSLILIPIAYYFAIEYHRKNRALISRTVSRVFKTSMLTVFLTLPLSIMMMENGYNIFSIIGVVLLYCAIAMGLSQLPVILYKKYHRSWLACLPLLLLGTFVYYTVRIFME